jgi:Ni/Co efflux regulator RcnB
MRYVLPVLGVALALSLSGTAYAADHDRGNRSDRGRDNNHVTHQNDNNKRFDRRGDRQRGPVAQNQNRQWQGQRNDNNRWRNNDNRQRGPVVNRDNNNWRPPVTNNNNNWRNQNNNWRNQNARSNWQQYRRNYNSPRRFHVGVYHGPRGYNYRRYSYGQHLPSAYYARPFWLLNAIAYGLFSPPPGLIWVRYGDDALLIDQYTGEIVQVRYDVFY